MTFKYRIALATDDNYLVRLLGVNKFSMEKTKQKVDNLYTARTMLPEFFTNRDPLDPSLSKYLQCVDFAYVPTLVNDNSRINILRIALEDPNEYEATEVFKLAFMVTDIRLHLDIACGDILIWDMKYFHFGHVVKTSPAVMKKGMFVIQSCFGARIKSIHMVNAHPYTDTIVNILKSILKKKIAERIYIHKTIEDLHNYIPKESLPSDLGGDNPMTIKDMADEVRKAVLSPEWRQWFLDSMSLKSDESLRPAKSETMMDDLLGIRGTFRKLDID